MWTLFRAICCQRTLCTFSLALIFSVKQRVYQPTDLTRARVFGSELLTHHILTLEEQATSLATNFLHRSSASHSFNRLGNSFPRKATYNVPNFTGRVQPAVDQSRVHKRKSHQIDTETEGKHGLRNIRVWLEVKRHFRIGTQWKYLLLQLWNEAGKVLLRKFIYPLWTTREDTITSAISHRHIIYQIL